MATHYPEDVQDDEFIDDSKPRHLSFFAFWALLLFQPTTFFRDYFSKRSSPYVLFAVLVVGMAGAIDRYETTLAKPSTQRNVQVFQTLNTWPAMWGICVVTGSIGAALYYFLGGWWYNVRVGWAGGNKDPEASRFLYSYSAFIPSFPMVAMSMAASFSRPTPFPDTTPLLQSLIISVCLLAATIYSVYVSYCGVTTVMNPTPAGARLWFLVLPLVLYALAFSAVIFLFLTLIRRGVI